MSPESSPINARANANNKLIPLTQLIVDSATLIAFYSLAEKLKFLKRERAPFHRLKRISVNRILQLLAVVLTRATALIECPGGGGRVNTGMGTYRERRRAEHRETNGNDPIFADRWKSDSRTEEAALSISREPLREQVESQTIP